MLYYSSSYLLFDRGEQKLREITTVAFYHEVKDRMLAIEIIYINGYIYIK
jgi:hypothetical protein